MLHKQHFDFGTVFLTAFLNLFVLDNVAALGAVFLAHAGRRVDARTSGAGSGHLDLHLGRPPRKICYSVFRVFFSDIYNGNIFELFFHTSKKKF